MKKLCIALCVFSMFGLSTACSSPKGNALQDTPTAPQTEVPHTDTVPAQAEEAPAPKIAQATDLHPKKAENANPSAIPYPVSYKNYPEIRAESLQKKTAWGTIERTTLLWHKDIEIFYEIPVFEEVSPTFAKINKLMQSSKAHFFSESNLQSALEYEAERPDHTLNAEDDKFFNTYEVHFMNISDNYISFGLMMNWFMGGTQSYGLVTYNFDPQTGENIKLTDLYQKSPEDIRQMIIQSVKAYAEDKSDSGAEMIDWDLLAQVKDFSFYIDQSTPHVVFQKYEIAPGAAGAFDMPLPKPEPK